MFECQRDQRSVAKSCSVIAGPVYLVEVVALEERHHGSRVKVVLVLRGLWRAGARGIDCMRNGALERAR